MGIVNKYERLEALERQKLLHDNRCVGCPYRPKSYNGKRGTFSKTCKRCPVFDEFLEIGRILDGTLRERAIWDYDKDENEAS